MRGGSKTRFGVWGMGRSVPGEDGKATYMWFNHGSNAALSGTRQDGADGMMLIFDGAGPRRWYAARGRQRLGQAVRHQRAGLRASRRQGSGAGSREIRSIVHLAPFGFGVGLALRLASIYNLRMSRFTRRQILAAAPFVAAAAAAPARLPIRKAVEFSMLPGKIPVLDRFQMARDAGFEAIECPTMPDAAAAEEALAASRKTQLPIHSVMNSEHWRSPLSSADPAVVEKSMEGMRTSLRNAKLWGADTVLLVPAVVNPETSYAQAWERSQRQIRKLIPLAEEAKVIIGIEEVWNKFLLSPLEFARYVDEFNSPWIRAYFDIGNVAIQAYPQDWIRTLGKRIVKVHVKDFSFKKRLAEFTPLLEGEIDWRAVHAALADIGYQGTATVELSGGDAAYLKEVNSRFEKILTGQV